MTPQPGEAAAYDSQYDLLVAVSALAGSIGAVVTLIREAEAEGDEYLAEVFVDALLHRLTELAAGIERLDPGFRDRTPQVPWRDIVRLPQLLGHRRIRIGAEVAGTTLKGPLAALRRWCGRELVVTSRTTVPKQTEERGDGVPAAGR